MNLYKVEYETRRETWKGNEQKDAEGSEYVRASSKKAAENKVRKLHGPEKNVCYSHYWWIKIKEVEKLKVLE